MISFIPKALFNKPAALVCLTAAQVSAGVVPVVDKGVAAALNAVLGSGKFEGTKGEMFPVVCGRCLVLLLGLGKEEELTLPSLRVLLRRALGASFFKKTADIEVVVHRDGEDVVRALIDAHVIGAYAWKKYITRKKEDTTVEHKHLHIVAEKKALYTKLNVIAAAVNFTRDIINENADITTAEYLAKTVRGLVKGNKEVTLDVLGRKELAAGKFGLILAVNRGSAQAPRIVVACYNGGRNDEPYTALVGKGLTFDSGGLNLKPSGSMETMRSDMSGAAAIIGTLKTVLELGIKKNIIFAFGAAENAIDANAYKPGDVITGYAGKSVEVGNTDAEGRLVLADVIAYVIDKYKPARLVDIATLTGACVVGLGYDYAGLMSNNDALADAILASAAATDDRAWRLPLYPELKDMIKSKIADMKNISNQKGSAGTMTGAEFLHQFVGEVPWAHLDIAGTAFVDGDSRMYFGHGATGYGVRLLTDFIEKN